VHYRFSVLAVNIEIVFEGADNILVHMTRCTCW